ncbi:hypothetical protein METBISCDRAFT_19842 [Metschnikowia bicuspidata]|uniref:Uncharacterized protein n=1 Tax=Metschnikowia bicuspidata TaxID=27322 RepID=A0A4P9Z8E5_9ASCO|nr:hypothetical protein METBISCDRAFT_19842 [Metschnikowia bicuspidata]
MAKKTATKTAGSKPKPLRKVTKHKSKTKLRLNSKTARAQTAKLDLDILSVQALHSTLTKVGQAPKTVNTLDAQSLREGLRKDAEMREKNARAEKDLTAQLEFLTGMEL